MRRLVVAGHGMVGHKLIETLVERGATSHWEIVVFAEEPQPAYDRVNLSSYLTGASEADLSLAAPDFAATSGITLHLGDPINGIDAGSGAVTSASPRLPYLHAPRAPGRRPQLRMVRRPPHVREVLPPTR